MSLTQCKKDSFEIDYSNFNKVIKKGAFEIYIPKYLHLDKKLHPKAAVAYCDSMNNSFYIIIREEIPDTEDDSITITLENYHKFACNGISTQLANSDVDEAMVDTLNLVPALTSTIDGKFGEHKVFYTVTTLKTSLYFYQLIGWTLYSYRNTVGTDLINASKSFAPVE